MVEQIQNLLRQKNILSHLNTGITICSVKDHEQGIDLAKDILYTIVDRKSVLYLSGGRTPKELYEKMAKDETLLPGAVGMIDERFGKRFHEKSNEKMIKGTGLVRYLEMRDIPFYPMLHSKTREETAELYDGKLRALNATFQKSVAILGIGSDGHTAGIPADLKLKTQNSKIFDNYDLVVDYDDNGGKYGERVTMTFVGLSMMDSLIVLVFGDDKKAALESMFQDGAESDIPARFYKRPEIAGKTIIITDQNI